MYIKSWTEYIQIVAHSLELVFFFLNIKFMIANCFPIIWLFQEI